jgi:hypothetical protein
MGGQVLGVGLVGPVKLQLVLAAIDGERAGVMRDVVTTTQEHQIP